MPLVTVAPFQSVLFLIDTGDIKAYNTKDYNTEISGLFSPQRCHRPCYSKHANVGSSRFTLAKFQRKIIVFFFFQLKEV